MQILRSECHTRKEREDDAERDYSPRLRNEGSADPEKSEKTGGYSSPKKDHEDGEGTRFSEPLINPLRCPQKYLTEYE